MAEHYFVDFVDSLPTKYDGIALDIGANHGMYTTKLSEKFQQVYAFEPQPDNIKLLRKAVNGRDNVKIIEKAISDKTGPLNLWISTNPGGHSISQAVGSQRTWGHDPDRKIEVSGITIDEFCQNMNVVFMKVDVEGAENFIFRGAVNTLLKNKVAILLEVHQTVDVNNLYYFFKYLGYKWFCFGKEVTAIQNDNHYLVSNI